MILYIDFVTVESRRLGKRPIRLYYSTAGVSNGGTGMYDLISNTTNEGSLWQRVPVYLQEMHKTTDMNSNECC